MNKKSFAKVVSAGFTFYRPRWNGNEGSIYKSTLSGSWALHAKGYKSKAALQRAIDDLIDNDPLAITES